MNITHIIDNIYLSDSIDNYTQLLDNMHKIDIVINTRTEQHDDLNELGKLGISYFYIPVGDFLSPRAGQVKIFMKIINKSKGNILIHCTEGRGRSVFFIVCLLVEKYKKSIEEAISFIKNKRPIIALTPIQMDKLKILYGEKK